MNTFFNYLNNILSPLFAGITVISFRTIIKLEKAKKEFIIKNNLSNSGELSDSGVLGGLREINDLRALRERELVETLSSYWPDFRWLSDKQQQNLLDEILKLVNLKKPIFENLSENKIELINALQIKIQKFYAINEWIDQNRDKSKDIVEVISKKYVQAYNAGVITETDTQLIEKFGTLTQAARISSLYTHDLTALRILERKHNRIHIDFYMDKLALIEEIFNMVKNNEL